MCVCVCICKYEYIKKTMYSKELFVFLFICE